MFDEYAKKFEQISEDVPKIFKDVARRGAIKFVNEAQDRTDREGLVDTGYYKDNWVGEMFNPQENVYGILGQNIAEYASFLEVGHRIKGTDRRFKGRFVGRMSLEEARYYCLKLLDDKFEKVFTKYNQKFTKE